MVVLSCSRWAARPKEIQIRRLARKSLQHSLAVSVDILCVVENCHGGENTSLYLRDAGMRSTGVMSVCKYTAILACHYSVIGKLNIRCANFP
jgi:hypothetical protein